LDIALEKVLRSDNALRGLDGAMKGKMNEVTTKIIERCLPDGQVTD
jgi:DNA-directed RNA polymerase I subunit RPA1